MKSSFKFDERTGTMMPINKSSNSSGVEERAASTTDIKPSFEKHTLDIKPDKTVNLNQNPVLQMERVSKPTPIQLVNKEGLPESYLDSKTAGIVMFRDLEDYDICQITDEKSGTVLAYIGGYALQMNFNMAELNTMERVEQCLQGITKLFRHKIMNQNLG